MLLALGFKNARAFQRARKAGKVEIPLFPLPGSRSVYARAADIETLKARVAEQSAVEEQDAVAEKSPPAVSARKS